MWTVAIMAKFQKLYWHLPGGPEEIHENYSQDSQFLDQDLNLKPPMYKAGMLPT
jgi:hypothetical protein